MNVNYLFPIIFSQIIAYVILVMNNDGGMNMEAGLWAVVLAIIGLIGSTWYQYAASKRDIKPLSGIQSHTSEMKPRIENIDDNTKKSRDILVKKIKPGINDIQRQQDSFGDQLKKIDYVVKEFEYQNRLKNEYSKEINKDILTAGINMVYEKNAMLEKTLHEKEQKIYDMTVKLQMLKSENQELQHQISEYENKYHKRNHDQGLAYKLLI